MIESRILRQLGHVALSVLAISLVITAGLEADDSKGWTALREGGRVALIRHGNAPPGYGGDPPGFKIDDCKTQRNLDELGVSKPGHLARPSAATACKWSRSSDSCAQLASSAFDV